MLLNILRIKGNQTMKFGQLIEHHNINQVNKQLQYTYCPVSRELKTQFVIFSP